MSDSNGLGDGTAPGRFFVQDAKKFVKGHRVLSGVTAALVAYVPVAAETGYYPQFGPIDKTIADDGDYGYFTRASASIETYDGVLFAEGSLYSNLSHQSQSCSTVYDTTTVNGVTVRTPRQSCTTQTVSDPTMMQVVSVSLTDSEGRLLVPEAGESSATWSLTTGERTETIACPAAGTELNLDVVVNSYDGTKTLHAQAVSDGECDATTGLRFSRPDGRPTAGIGW